MKPIQLSWKKPNFTCPHKYLLNRQKVEPNIKSPHNFSIGRHEIKNALELYGGIKGICTIDFKVRFCRKYWLYISDCICISQGPVINIGIGRKGRGGGGSG